MLPSMVIIREPIPQRYFAVIFYPLNLELSIGIRGGFICSQIRPI